MLSYITHMKKPQLTPAGWEDWQGTAIVRQYGAMRALFSLDEIDGSPSMPGGWYRHISFSKPHSDPRWEEMRDAIRVSGLFEPDRDVYMVLPPPREYVNLAEHCFHWWQRVSEGAA